MNQKRQSQYLGIENNHMHWIDRQRDRVWWLIVNEGTRVGRRLGRRVAVIFYLHILHLLFIILSLGCKAFISASPRVQWYCKFINEKIVFWTQVCSCHSLIGETASPGTHKPRIVHESLWWSAEVGGGGGDRHPQAGR